MNKDDYFSLEKIYPEAEKIFSFPYKSLSQVAKDCVFVLDTNVLLVPFDVSEKNFEVISDVFSKLKDQKRLYLPARVAREFAKNRGEKISQIFLKLRQKQQNFNSGHFKPESYPILDKSKSYKDLKTINEKILVDIKKAREIFKEIEDEILNWNWNDPISEIYRVLFTQDVIVELADKQEDIIEDLEFRIRNNIAPGYKDSNKTDKGIGDLIIWKTIIQIGKEKNQNVVFVSNDKKSDWYYRQDNEGIYPKYELFEEFRSKTDGKSINIIDFPKFLEISKIDEHVIQDVKETIAWELDQILNTTRKNRFEKIQVLYPNLRLGAVVMHQKFGLGTVVGLDGEEKNVVALIQFDNEDLIRRIVMKFAKLDFL